MSLKAFHILFITLSTLLALGFGTWSLKSYSATNDTRMMVLGIASFVVAVALIVYGVRFLKKLKALDPK